jgi:hypothetical protein
VEGIEIQAELAEAAASRLGACPGGIRVADALDPSTSWPARTWVVANPPWLSFSGRHRGGAAWIPRHGLPARGWPSLQSAFLVRIAEHVAQEGTGAVVLLPGSMMELARYGPVRGMVTELAHPLRLPEDLGPEAFPGVEEPAVLLELAPGSPPGGSSESPWSRTLEASCLLGELAAHPRFPAGSFGDPGVHTGNAARELVLPQDGPGLPLRQGRDLAAYHLGPASARLAETLPSRSSAYYRIGPLRSYQAFPILLRQTAARPIAALHVPPTYFRNSLLGCRGVAELDPAFLVAVLNSPTAAAWHRLRHRDARQRVFPQVKVGHLGTQPLPIRARDEDPRLHDEIVARVRALLSIAPERIEEERRSIEARIVTAFGLSKRANEELASERAPARSLEGMLNPSRTATCAAPC